MQDRNLDVSFSDLLSYAFSEGKRFDVPTSLDQIADHAGLDGAYYERAFGEYIFKFDTLEQTRIIS